MDFAQFWGISENIGESMRPILDVLQQVDPTFREIPHRGDPFITTAYRNKAKYRVEDGVIADIAFEGMGCAISTASASVLTEAVRGKTVAEAEARFRQMLDMLTHGPEHAEAVAADPELGPVAAFAGVSAYPSRIKCATLAWHALHKALEEGRDPSA